MYISRHVGVYQCRCGCISVDMWAYISTGVGLMRDKRSTTGAICRAKILNNLNTFTCISHFPL